MNENIHLSFKKSSPEKYFKTARIPLTMPKTIEYFAYGSNLNREQMKKREITIEDTEIVELPGWKLAFTIYSDPWDGAVGDIIPNPENRVEGVVYTIPEDDLKKLDHYEGRNVDNHIEVGMYRRQYLPVKSKEGWRTVLTYLVNRNIEHKSKVDLKPSKEYLQTIISGAKKHGLSEEYLGSLRSINYKE
ncbi:MAG: gamma-glutamylcyclotransferase [Candidatus Thermoplasmatota archaeon]|nr:gamma-glutamylcyclotransferase [Candidatus Thermoplasmatota archaeon]